MYKQFSEIYDQLVFDIDYDFYSQLIIKQVKSNGLSMDGILEIGAGTGNLALKIAPLAKEYVGVDLSYEMLTIAKEKLKGRTNVELACCDIRNYEADQKFNLAVSTLDTMNYILEPVELQEVFTSIYNLLEDDGGFIFDINSVYKLETVLGDNTFCYEYENVFYSWQNFYDKEEGIVDFVLDFFVEGEDGKYERIREEQSEKIYPLQQIFELLHNAGFKTMNAKDFDNGQEPVEESQRILITALK